VGYDKTENKNLVNQHVNFNFFLYTNERSLQI